MTFSQTKFSNAIIRHIKMPSLFKLIDAMSDMVISVVYTSSPDSRDSEPSTPVETEKPGTNDDNDNNSEDNRKRPKYNDKEFDRYPTSHRLHYPPTKRRPTIPYSKTRVPGSNSEYLAPKRFTKTPPITKNVHWSNMMEVDGGPPRFTAPGLNSYPLRRRRRANYVYGADGGDSNNNVNVQDTEAEDDADPSSAMSYEDQRYPLDWYSRSRSRSRNPSPAGSYPENCDRDTSSPGLMSPTNRSSAFPPYMPRSILKPPTATDDEMLLRNTWSMIARQEQQINYMYEFLSDVLLVGHDVLDCMFETGEISMWEDTTRRAQQAAQQPRVRRDARGSIRGSSPIPSSARAQPQFQDQGESQERGRSYYPVSYPGQSPRLGSDSRSAFEEELERREEKEKERGSPGDYSPVPGPRGPHLKSWLGSQSDPDPEYDSSRESSPVYDDRGSPSRWPDPRPDPGYGREGAMSRQEERSPPPGFDSPSPEFNGMYTIREESGESE
ncbi:hypothetical protein BJY00DRAFT_27521 [Aspergillus carlsbadensis]|nr:hypothetical protein BJY00DRAFT_27521 [Aspergillus carlsbadensis]